MKRSTIRFCIIVSGVLMCSSFVTGCTSKPKQEQNQLGVDSMKKDSTRAVVYTCSMHPEVTGKQGDKCPKCGMNLEAVIKADSTSGHNH